MTHDTECVLVDTDIEERDGKTWVSGLCPFCWERLAYPAPPRGSVVTVQCPGGHPLRIEDQTSATSGFGAHAA